MPVHSRLSVALPVASLLVLALASPPAFAACTSSTGELPQLAPINDELIEYDPAQVSRRAIRWAVVAPAGLIRPCTVRVVVATPPAWELANIADLSSTLSYELTGRMVETFLINPDPGGTVQLEGQIYIGANQSRAPGGRYAQQLTVSLLDATNGFPGFPIDTKAFEISALIVSNCSLPSPSLSSLDLSDAIANGQINSLMTFSTSFIGAGCNAGGRLTVNGAPMVRASGPGSIDFRAVSTLGPNQLTLDTRDGGQVSTPIDPIPPGTLSLTVNLLPGAGVLPAGDYSSVITVTLEPVQ